MDWPRTTKKQREILLRVELQPDYYRNRERNSILALVYKGLVETWGCFTGYAITQRGYDFCRFGMRR